MEHGDSLEGLGSAEHWDARYLGSDRLFVGKADGALVEYASKLEPGSALDLGAGEGRNSIHLASSGWSVTAVDFSGVALERLASFYDGSPSIQCVQSDLLEFLGSGPPAYDLVVMANIHPPRSERLLLYRLAQKAVKPGGHLFLIGHHIDSLGKVGPSDPDRLLSESEITEGFDLLQIEWVGVRLDSTDAGHEPAPSLVAWLSRR